MQVNTTYSSHHTTVLRHVLNIEADDIKREADKDWTEQENKIFKIVPATAEDPKGREGKEEVDYRKKKLFFFKNGALRMRTRSLVLFLDKVRVLCVMDFFVVALFVVIDGLV